MRSGLNRRSLLATLPLAAGVTAGCQDDSSSTPTDGRQTAAPDGETDDDTPASNGVTPGSVDSEIGLDPLSHHPSRARVIREFLPDAGPAAIAVGFPTESTEEDQACCFDAGACQVRYAWSGGFIDVPYTKDDTGSLGGERYYTASQGFPLRFGSDDPPETVSFEGYELVEGHPEFHYTADGTSVGHRLTAPSSGRGLTHEFAIPDPGGSVTYVAGGDSGVEVEASAGSWDGDRLTVPAGAASEFTVSITGGSA